MNSLIDDELIRMKKEASTEIHNVLEELEKYSPGITGELSGIGGGITGGTVGGAISLATLFFGGKVVGLSAAGVTSGLAAAGAVAGGGMVAGVGVLALPVVVLAAAGYAGVKKYKNVKRTTTFGKAISELCDIKSRLIQHEEHFKEEIAYIDGVIASLKKR